VKKKDNLMWVVSAFERESGKIVSFKVGRRTNKTLKIVVDTLKKLGLQGDLYRSISELQVAD
jgi:IS1 family transposase